MSDWQSDDRLPWVANSLRARISDLRAAERRCRQAFTKSYMGEPANYLADAYREAADLLEAKLPTTQALEKDPAALAHSKIEPLRWRHVDVEFFEANTPLGFYEASCQGWSFEPDRSGRTYVECASVQDAKAGAAQHHENRALRLMGRLSVLENQKRGLADAHSKNPPEAEHG